MSRIFHRHSREGGNSVESRVRGGISLLRADARSWIPAFAEMTIQESVR